MLRLTFAGCLISILCGCALDSNQIRIVKSSTIEDWSPNTIESQIALWDCKTIDWDVVQKRSDFSVVSASCKSQKLWIEDDEPDRQACLSADSVGVNSTSTHSHLNCQPKADISRQIQFRFLVHQNKEIGRVSLLDAKDLHVIKDKVVHEKPLSRSEVQHGPLSFSLL